MHKQTHSAFVTVMLRFGKALLLCIGVFTYVYIHTFYGKLSWGCLPGSCAAPSGAVTKVTAVPMEGTYPATGTRSPFIQLGGLEQ